MGEDLRTKFPRYSEALETVNVGRETIFLNGQSKRDLETALWKLDHRLAAASYHVERVSSLVNEVENRLRAESGSSDPGAALATREVVLRDDRVPFEMEAFFFAGRSALDYFAQVVSRYVEDRNFSSMRKLGGFARNRSVAHPCWTCLGSAPLQKPAHEPGSVS